MRVTNRIKVLTYYLQLLKTRTVTLLCFSTHFLQTEALSQKQFWLYWGKQIFWTKKIAAAVASDIIIIIILPPGQNFCAKKKRLISDIIISKRHLRSQQAQHDYRYRNSPSPQNKEKKQRCFLPDRESTACHATHSHTCFLGKPSSWLHWQAKPNQLTRKCPPSHGQYFCLFFFM